MALLTIDLGKIEHNTRVVAELLAPYGVGLVGVTKACPGHEGVARAMLAGGARALADSRPGSVRRLKRRLPDARYHMLRPLSGRAGAPLPADLYFLSSADQARALAASAATVPIAACLMIECGDCREGVPAGLAAAEAGRLMRLPEVDLVGVAAIAACAREALDPGAALGRFRRAAAPVLELLATLPAAGSPGNGGPVISAGGSGLLRLLLGQPAADRTLADFAWLTDLRCGEALLLGRIPGGPPLPGGALDAFVIEAPVVEVYAKEGRQQALAGIGVRDIGAGSLAPLHAGVTVRGMTSDYLAVAWDAKERGAPAPAVGDTIGFIPSYYALLGAMASPRLAKMLVAA